MSYFSPRQDTLPASRSCRPSLCTIWNISPAWFVRLGLLKRNGFWKNVINLKFKNARKQKIKNARKSKFPCPRNSKLARNSPALCWAEALLIGDTRRDSTRILGLYTLKQDDKSVGVRHFLRTGNQRSEVGTFGTYFWIFSTIKKDFLNFLSS